MLDLKRDSHQVIGIERVRDMRESHAVKSFFDCATVKSCFNHCLVIFFLQATTVSDWELINNFVRLEYRKIEILQASSVFSFLRFLVKSSQSLFSRMISLGDSLKQWKRLTAALTGYHLQGPRYLLPRFRAHHQAQMTWQVRDAHLMGLKLTGIVCHTLIITVGQTLCSERMICERINLHLILVNGALCSLESQHTHARCSCHAVEAKQNTKSG